MSVATPIWRHDTRAPRDHRNMRILQAMVAGIPLILSLGTRISDPYGYVEFGAPRHECIHGGCQKYPPWFGQAGTVVILGLLHGSCSLLVGVWPNPRYGEVSLWQLPSKLSGRAIKDVSK